jgi:transposase
MDRDELARMLEEGLSLEEIGRRVGRHPSTVGYWVRKHGLAAANAERHANTGGIARDRLEQLVARDLTVRQIAEELECCAATVRHWLKRHDLRTTAAARQHAKSSASADGRFEAVCRHHGRTDFTVRRDGTSACLRCRAAAVSAWRRRVKEMLVEEAGGCCAICGYDAYIGALQFHHVDPATKRFSIAGRGLGRSMEVLREEAAKCVLLCANHLAEVEAGRVSLPLRSAA